MSALSLRELTAHAALAGLVTAGFAMAIAGADTRHSFAVAHRGHAAPPWILGLFAHSAVSLTAVRYIALLCIMWVLYLVVLSLAENVRMRWAVTAIVLLTLVFTIGPPLGSTDVFNYIDYGRLGVIHHVNPYLHGPKAAPHDQVFPLTKWHGTPSVYGPIFTAISYALVPLGLAGALWSLKVLTGLAGLGCVALVWRCARSTGASQRYATLLMGLNPVFLVFAVAGAHNDVLALFALIGAITLLVEARGAMGGAATVASVAVKATGAVVAPFMLLGSAKRWQLLAGMLAGAALIVVLAFPLFGTAMVQPFKLVVQHQKLYNDQAVPGYIAVLLDIYPRAHGVHVTAQAIDTIAVAGLLVWTARTRDWLTGAGWAMVVVIVSATFMLAWYTIFALPFAALARRPSLLYAVLALGTFIVASHLYYFTL